MNKEDILKKSRESGEDEGMTHVADKGRAIGFMAFCAIFLFVTLYDFLNGQSNHAVRAMFWAFVAAEAWPKYRFTREKAYLVTVIAGGIAAVASLINYVIG